MTDSLRQHIHRYLLGITSLKNGHLPSELISFVQLREVLHDVSKQLPRNIVLGIPVSDITKYYTHQLASFSQGPNETQIHLAIPLKEDRKPQTTSLYRPVYNPFPIPHVWARGHSLEEFVQVSMPSEYWVFNGRVFLRTVTHEELSCQTRGDFRSCMSFNTYFRNELDPCRLQLIYRNISRIASHCNFETPTGVSYHPILVENGTYIAHFRNDVSYSVECSGKEEADVRIPERWLSIHVPSACVLTMYSDNGISHFGGHFSRGRESQSNVTLHSPPWPGAAFGVNVKPHGLHKRSREYLDVVTESSIVSNNRLIQESHHRIRRQLEQISKVANDLTSSSAVIPFTFWNTVDLITHTIFDLLILFIIFGMIASGRWIFWISPAVTILVPPVAAVEFSLNPLDYLPNPMDLVTASGLSHLLTLFKLVILLIGVIVIILRNVLYKIEISYHTGLALKSTSRFYLEVSFIVINKRFRKTAKSLVTLRVPIQHDFPPETVSVLSLKETNAYHLSRHGLYLAEPLTIRGLYSDGTYSSTGDLRVLIQWADLRWERNNPPRAVRSGNNGAAFVRVIPDPRRI